MWHNCRSVPIAKPGVTKPGVLGIRLIHVFSSSGGAWYKGLGKQHQFPWVPNWIFGGLPGRAREGALIVQQSSVWRLGDVDRSGILTLYDATNAFSSAPHPKLADVAIEWFSEDVFFCGRHMDMGGMEC